MRKVLALTAEFVSFLYRRREVGPLFEITAKKEDWKKLKQHGIRLVNFETAWTHFLRDVFRAVVFA